MLLQIQKPGLKYAMQAKDWREKFGRWPKEGARPLIIMWPFGPVGFGYDQLDTEGADLPQDAFSFIARGNTAESDILRMKERLSANETFWFEIDQGDAHAGLVRILKHSTDPNVAHQYRININKNHDRATQFSTLAHELGHIYLGHLGLDSKRSIKDRRQLSPQQFELEAESVSYLICARAGIEPRSEPYLSQFVAENRPIEKIDVYAVMKAAGAIEAVLELNPRAFQARLM